MGRRLCKEKPSGGLHKGIALRQMDSRGNKKARDIGDEALDREIIFVLRGWKPVEKRKKLPPTE